MIRILFVCHGNICRSPMAEFVMKDLMRRNGLQDSYHIESCATSSEELGHDMYPPAKDELDRRGVPYSRRSARRMTKDDYDRFDMIVAMDHQNLRNLRPFVGDDPDHKVSLMLSCRRGPGRGRPLVYRGFLCDVQGRAEGMRRHPQGDVPVSLTAHPNLL